MSGNKILKENEKEIMYDVSYLPEYKYKVVLKETGGIKHIFKDEVEALEYFESM